jgi:hypothetical protein
MTPEREDAAQALASLSLFSAAEKAKRPPVYSTFKPGRLGATGPPLCPSMEMQMQADSLTPEFLAELKALAEKVTKSPIELLSEDLLAEGVLALAAEVERLKGERDEAIKDRVPLTPQMARAQAEMWQDANSRAQAAEARAEALQQRVDLWEPGGTLIATGRALFQPPAEIRSDIEPRVDPTDCPKPGEIRILGGDTCRFIERELEGDKWEILGPAQPPAGDAG